MKSLHISQLKAFRREWNLGNVHYSEMEDLGTKNGEKEPFPLRYINFFRAHTLSEGVSSPHHCFTTWFRSLFATFCLFVFTSTPH